MLEHLPWQTQEINWQKWAGREGAEHKMVKQTGQAHSTCFLWLNFTTLPRLCSLVSGHKTLWTAENSWGHSWMITGSFCDRLLKSRTQDQMIRIIAKIIKLVFYHWLCSAPHVVIWCIIHIWIPYYECIIMHDNCYFSGSFLSWAKNCFWPLNLCPTIAIVSYSSNWII